MALKNQKPDPHVVAGSEEQESQFAPMPGSEIAFGVYGYFNEDANYYHEGYEPIFHEFSDPESNVNIGRIQQKQPLDWRRVTTIEEHNRLAAKSIERQKRVSPQKAKEMSGDV